MAVEITPLGFKKPDGAELVRGGDNVIADNAQTAETRLQAILGRLGQAEANINAGNGNGPGLTEDPLNPGTFFMADNSPITADPDYTGLYTF